MRKGNSLETFCPLVYAGEYFRHRWNRSARNKPGIGPKDFMMKEVDFLLRPKDAAKRLAISERHLWTLSKGGKIPVVRLGRATRYHLADLMAFIEVAKEVEHET